MRLQVFIQLHNHYQFPAITKDSQELPTQVKPLLRSLHTAENATILFVDTKDPMVYRLNMIFVQQCLHSKFRQWFLKMLLFMAQGKRHTEEHRPYQLQHTK